MSIASLDSSSLDFPVAPALNELDVAAEPGLQVRLPLREEFALVLQNDRGDSELQRRLPRLGVRHGVRAGQAQNRKQPMESVSHIVLPREAVEAERAIIRS